MLTALKFVRPLTISTAVVCGLVQFSMAQDGSRIYDGDVVYVLKELDGREFPSLPPGAIEFRTAVTMTDQDRSDFSEGRLLDNLRDIESTEAARKILLALRQAAVDAGIESHKFDVFLLGNQIPAVTARASQIEKVMANVDRKRFKWEIHSQPRPEQQVVKSDMKRLLNRKLDLILSLVSDVEREILGRVSGSAGKNQYDEGIFSTADHLNSLNLPLLLQKIESMKELGGWADAPARIFTTDGHPNLAQMTAAEAAWEEQMTSLQFSLEKLVRYLNSLGPDEINKYISRRQTIADATAKLTQYYDGLDAAKNGQNLIFLASQPKEELEAKARAARELIVQATSSLLLGAKFDRHSQRHWTKVDPIILMPLVSYSLLAALQTIERFPGFRAEFYGEKGFTQNIYFILSSLISENFKMDEITKRALTILAKTESLHGLLRLTSLALLEKNLGRPEAEQLTGIDLMTFLELFSKAKSGLHLSPSRSSLRSEAFFDVQGDFKLPFARLVRLVEDLGVTRGVSTGLPIPNRSTEFDPSLPSRRDNADEVLLRRIRKNRQRNDGAQRDSIIETEPAATESVVVANMKNAEIENSQSPIGLLPGPSHSYRLLHKFTGAVFEVMANGDVVMFSRDGLAAKVFSHPSGGAESRSEVEISLVNRNLVIKYPKLGFAKLFSSPLYDFAYSFEPQEYIAQRIFAPQKPVVPDRCRNLFTSH